MRRCLLISPYFAPQAALGAYRWVKIARHLPALGWAATVVAARFPNDSLDPELSATLPPEVVTHEAFLDPRLIAARTALGRLRGPSSVTGPIEGLRPFHSIGDRCLLHVPHASRRIVELARAVSPQVVVVSAGPFSACEVGLRVARAIDVPLVLDMRDPWSLHETRTLAPAGVGAALRARAIDALEARWFGAASRIVLNTRGALDAYRRKYPAAADRMVCVRNHFDPELYVDELPSPPDDRFVLMHLGALRAEVRLDDIVRAVGTVRSRRGVHGGRVLIRQVGRVSEFDRRAVDALGATTYFESAPPVPYRRVRSVLRSANLLVTMVAPHVTLRIAAKTYDYLASGMPVLSVTANREVDDLFSGLDHCTRVEPGDLAALTAALDREVERWLATGGRPAPRPAPEPLTSALAAERFAALFGDAIASRPAASTR